MFEVCFKQNNEKILVCYIIFISHLILAGCSSSSMLTSNKATDVAMVLQPVTQSNINDQRAGFRALFCQINKDHGALLPDHRSKEDCSDSLHLLKGETPIQKHSFVNSNKSDTNSTKVGNSLAFKTKVVIVPGIFGECLIKEVSPFSYAIDHIKQEFGDLIDVEVIDSIRGRASSEWNSEIIHKYLTNLYENKQKKDNEKLIVLGYSKGVTDLLFYLNRYSRTAPIDGKELDGTVGNIDAIVSVAGVVNGTPLADDVNSVLKKLASWFPFEECPTQDSSGIDSLTRQQQLLNLSKQKLPTHIKYFSLPAFTQSDDTSSILKPFHRKLSLIDPRNDSQVVYYDAIIPRSNLLGYANADHWAVILPFNRHIDDLSFLNKVIAKKSDKNAYPREILFEAIIRFIDSTF